ncbi:MAG: DNA repair protein RecO [Pirellulales bacterium]|nr:DNA repair protein RecO [Pirellulales bacterium]
MSTEKATAIVIRLVDFSESSLVTTLYCREFGKIGALAKGAKRLKGPFESALDLLALCRIVFLRKTSDALDLLTEAKLLRRFWPAGKDLLRLYAGYYVAELLGDLTDEGEPHPQLFDLADETLVGLMGDEPVPQRVIRFELGLLRELGHTPSWETCVGCGRTVPTTGRIAFGHLDGGVLCTACRTGKKHVATVSAGAVRTLAQMADPLGNAWRRLEINPQRLGELRGILNHYLAHLLGRKPRMQAYLNKWWSRST